MRRVTTAAAGELRPRDLPDSSREEKGERPRSWPWRLNLCTGAALQIFHLPVATEVAADASIHQPNIEFLLPSLISEGLPCVFGVGCSLKGFLCGI